MRNDQPDWGARTNSNLACIHRVFTAADEFYRLYREALLNLWNVIGTSRSRPSGYRSRINRGQLISTAVNELVVCDAGISATLTEKGGYGHQHVYSEHEQKGDHRIAMAGQRC